MKKITFILLSMLLSVTSGFSRPAYPGTARVQQPDGSFVTIRLVGDEYRSFNTTSDGYTLTRDKQGYYVYAQLDDEGRLAPTTLIAHDSAERSFQELDYLKSVGRRLTPRMSDAQASAMSRNKVARAEALAQRRAARYDYSKFRGLVILVEYNDCSFLYDDYHDIVDKMINEDNYSGEPRTNVNSVTCTGSIRDYFRDNSSGAFVPHFDVVGPVKINRSQYYPRPDGDNSSDNYAQLITDAVNAADDLVNFKDYDVNGDGIVDMIYFIFSGIGSYVLGNDQRLLWPHQSDIRYKYVRKDGVYIGRYACSTELLGTDAYSMLDGIGTITHEFSHVLGLPDFYDTNNTNDEECVHPDKWSIMANGADGNLGRTPVNYSLYERYALGFATPQVINDPGDYSIKAIHIGNSGFRINTPVKKEFFLLENRQKEKWDSALPGHGMLIFRVDSTNSYMWTYNAVNDNPNHPYYELIRARGAESTENFPILSTSRDPFPGTSRVTKISNTTTPANLLSWAGKECDFALKDITELNSVISFNAYLTHVLTDIILPENATMGYGTTMQLTATLVPENARTTLTWTSDNNAVAIVDATGLVSAISEGTAKIIVKADNNISDTCTVTVEKQDIVPNIAAFRALSENKTAQLTLNDAQVLYKYEDDFYVRDATGSLRISGTDLNASQNNVLNGPLFGKLELDNRLPQLSAVENATSTSSIVVNTKAEAASPLEVKHNGTLTDDMLCNLITLKGVELTLENKMVFAKVGSQQARMYNTFRLTGISTPNTKALSGKYFDVTGILTTTVANGSTMYVISLTDSVIEVEKPADDVLLGDVNGDGTIDIADISAIITIMANSVEYDEKADVNGDGAINVADISTVISIMAGDNE